jgi:8-amino-7-oxononanoate synthase
MDFSAELAAIKARNLYRSYHTLSAPQDKQTVIDGRETLLFSSNNYLGLANQETIKQQAAAALARYGTGSGGSRLTTGNFDLHMGLEARLEEFKSCGSAIVFNCGYMANVGAISSLGAEGGVIFSDALNHASIIDGCRLAKSRTVTYAHNDLDDLRGKIAALRPPSGLIVTDGVFSMDGDLARLPDLAQIARDNGLLLMVDDAHATGVIGATGRGSTEHFGLAHDDVAVVMGTLSKAVGSEGGFICGQSDLSDYLRNTARSFIFSTALAPATIAAATGGIEYIMAHPERTRRLQDNIRYFVDKLNEIGVQATGESAIIPVIIGDETKALTASAQLFDQGIFVPCIRYPTVKKGAARLRLTLMATHTQSDMDYVIHSLKSLL